MHRSVFFSVTAVEPRAPMCGSLLRSSQVAPLSLGTVALEAVQTDFPGMRAHWRHPLVSRRVGLGSTRLRPAMHVAVPRRVWHLHDSFPVVRQLWRRSPSPGGLGCANTLVSRVHSRLLLPLSRVSKHRQVCALLSCSCLVSACIFSVMRHLAVRDCRRTPCDVVCVCVHYPTLVCGPWPVWAGRVQNLAGVFISSWRSSAWVQSCMSG